MTYQQSAIHLKDGKPCGHYPTLLTAKLQKLDRTASRYLKVARIYWGTLPI